MLIAGTVDRRVEGGHVLEQAGNATWTDDGVVRLASASTWHVLPAATLDIQGDTQIVWSGGAESTLLNEGTIRKSGTSGDATLVGVILFFENQGLLQVEAGTWRHAGGGDSGGVFDVQAGATYEFANNGTRTLEASSSLTGAGTVVSTGGATTILGTYDVTLTSIELGSIYFDGASDALTGELDMSGGFLRGVNALVVAGACDWTGGFMRDTGTTRVEGLLSLTGTTDRRLESGRVLEQVGDAIWTEAGIVRLASESTWHILPEATLDIQDDAQVIWSGGVASTVLNEGTIRKSGTSGGATILGVSLFFENEGLVQVEAGTWRHAGAGDSGGVFDVQEGATYEFANNGTRTFEAASSLTGAGTVASTGGTTTILGTYDVDLTSIELGSIYFDGASDALTGELDMSGGFLRGLGDVVVVGPCNWTGGFMRDTGTTRVEGLLSISGTADRRLEIGRLLEQAGDAVWTETGIVRLASESTWHILPGATLDVQDDTQIIWSGGASSTLLNEGTIVKSGTSGGATSFGANLFFENEGLVQIEVGTWQHAGAGDSGGGFDVQGGTTYEFANNGTRTLEATSSLTGAGTVLTTGGTTNILGTYDVNLTSIEGGSIYYDGVTAALTGALDMSGGFLRGLGDVVVVGPCNWTGGFMRDAGTTRVEGLLSISGTADRRLETGRLLEQADDAVWTEAGIVRLASESTWHILPGATLDVQDDAQIIWSGGAASTLLNEGTIVKSGTSGGATSIGANLFFQTSGVVDVATGELSISGTFTQTAGATRLSGGSLSTSSVLVFEGGALEGAGQIDGDVDNLGASVEPGLGIGVLEITGDYVQQAAAGSGGAAVGTLVIEVEEALPDTAFDALVVGGTATLGGTLVVDSPEDMPCTTIGPVMTYAVRDGGFDDVVCLSTCELCYGLDWMRIRFGEEPCAADVSGDCLVSVEDLVAVILAWGPCPDDGSTCPEDVNDDGVVDVQDLVGVIVGWGACPCS
ncbi:MAG: hypothetical protein ACYTGR_17820, partial [Planctomycetota bacterium]|jgi:hypothetical protein